MEEPFIVAGLVVCFLITMITVMAKENKRQREKFRNSIREMWGSIPGREYSRDLLNSISHYSMRREDRESDFFIDDITWNDLDMDRIFMLINQTMSSLGEDYLYYMLRKPEFSQEKLSERQRLTDYFRGHKEERVSLQLILGKLKRLPTVSLSDSLYVLTDAKVHKRAKHIACALLMLLSILIMIVIPRYGVFIMLGMMVFNVMQYLASKHEIETYLSCLRSILRLLEGAKETEKLKIPELFAYLEQMEKARSELGQFQRGAGLVINRSDAAGGLETIILDYIRMIFHVDMIKFNSMLKELQEHFQAVETMIEVFGFLDSCIAVASFQEAMPYTCVPRFTEPDKKNGQVAMEVSNLYHPLIKEPVANSISVAGGTLVTGSNASGKSTFLKNIAVNVILAQTLGLCVATEYSGPFLRVMTSMALRDDLQSGESYYIVEIKSLNRILEAAKEKTPLLCVIDEVLRGTNTIERIAASSNILAALCQNHVLPFAATHDIELSYMLEKLYNNYHFEEEVKEHDVVFNYLLKSGRATTRNAIRLLEMIGYDKKIIENAKRAAEIFEEKGVWAPVKKEGKECL